MIGTSVIFPLDMVKTRMQNVRCRQACAATRLRRGAALRCACACACVGAACERTLEQTGRRRCSQAQTQLLAAALCRVRAHTSTRRVDASFRLPLRRLLRRRPRHSSFAAPPLCCSLQMKTPNLALGERALYAGPIDCFRQIVRKEGVAGLYRGLRPNLIGVMPEKSLKLTVNDVCREAFTESNGPGGGIRLHQEMISGATAGFVQVAATNPMEIVKLRLQLQGEAGGVKRSAMEVIRELGPRGLYKGIAACWLRDVPFSIVRAAPARVRARAAERARGLRCECVARAAMAVRAFFPSPSRRPPTCLARHPLVRLPDRLRSWPACSLPRSPAPARAGVFPALREPEDGLRRQQQHARPLLRGRARWLERRGRGDAVRRRQDALASRGLDLQGRRRRLHAHPARGGRRRALQGRAGAAARRALARKGGDGNTHASLPRSPTKTPLPPSLPPSYSRACSCRRRSSESRLAPLTCRKSGTRSGWRRTTRSHEQAGNLPRAGF